MVARGEASNPVRHRGLVVGRATQLGVKKFVSGPASSFSWYDEISSACFDDPN